MDRATMLNAPIDIKSFMSRGEITINNNILSYDIQNGIASFRFIKVESSTLSAKNLIIGALSNKWNVFEDYFNIENNNAKELYEKFYAYLTYGYYKEETLCFYILAIVNEIYQADIYKIDVFSPCLIDHFEDASNFDFNNFGYIDDTPCAICNVDNGKLKIYKTVAVEFNRNKISQRLSFQKKFVGGFRFEYSKPFTNSLFKRCVDAVNKYCCFLLKDDGFFISNVEIIETQEPSGRSYVYYPPKIKEIETEILFTFADIAEIFNSLMGMFFEETANFSALYNFETNVYQPIDILRIASMFENQYRKNVKAKMVDYVKHEKEYREAYLKVVEIKDVEGELENIIIGNEKAHQKNLYCQHCKCNWNLFIINCFMC